MTYSTYMVSNKHKQAQTFIKQVVIMNSSSEIYPAPTYFYERRSTLLEKYLVHAAVSFLKGIKTLALLRDKGLKRTAQTHQCICEDRRIKTHMTSILADGSVQSRRSTAWVSMASGPRKKKSCRGGENYVLVFM